MRDLGGRCALAALVAAFAIAASAPIARDVPKAPGAGAGELAPSMSLGGLARRIVTEVALNSPRDGFDESTSLGIVRAAGYSASKPSSAAATVGDLKTMLAAYGVETTTQNPAEILTALKVEQTLNQVRSRMPHYTVPTVVVPVGETGHGGKPGPCETALMACKLACRQRSPSGTGGSLSHCFSECNAAFDKCKGRG
jgi:hypothetical protein